MAAVTVDDVELGRVERLIAASVELSVAADLDEITAIVRHVARELTGADGATFVLRDGDRCFYVDEDAIAPLWKGRRFPMETCISGWVMQHRESVCIEDIYRDERIPADAYRPTFVKSLAMVPIRRQSPIGAIGNYWADPHRATPAEIGLLQGLADLVSVAIENVQRGRALARRAAWDALLAELASSLSRTLDHREALRNVGRILVPRAADGFAVELADEGDAAFVVMVPDEPWVRRAIEAVRRDRPGNAASGEGPRLGELPPASEDGPVTSFGSAPLVAEARPVGVLHLFASAAATRETGPLDMAFLRDVAGQCSSAVEHSVLYERAQQAVRVRDEFLSIASHELKTPLTSLDIQREMLSVSAEQLARPEQLPSLRKRVEAIERQLGRLRRLVQTLLDVSRIVSGRVRLELETVELTELVREVSATFEDWGKTGSDIELDLEGPLTGRWDRMRLEQVIVNLVGNALKYGNDRPVEIRTRRCDGFAVLEVQDAGIGIALEDQPRIFGQFERAVSGRSYGGLGMGLFIAREFVEAMGGKISVRSQPGDGATFDVLLPLGPG